MQFIHLIIHQRTSHLMYTSLSWKHSQSLPSSLLSIHLIVLCIIIYLQIFLLVLTNSTIYIIVVMFMLTIYILIRVIISSSKRICSTLSTHFLYEIIHMSWIICLLSQNISTSSDLFDKCFFLLSFTHLNTFLDYIITVSIFHHLIKSTI